MTDQRIKPGQVVININRQTIDRNTKAAKTDAPPPPEPPIRIQRGRYGKPINTDRAVILGQDGLPAATIEYDSTGHLLPCGARLVIVCLHGAETAGGDQVLTTDQTTA